MICGTCAGARTMNGDPVCRECGRTFGESPRRFVLLGGPGGYMTVVPAGSPLLERYGGWTTLLRVNVPRRLEPDARNVAGEAKQWALDVFGANA